MRSGDQPSTALPSASPTICTSKAPCARESSVVAFIFGGQSARRGSVTLVPEPYAPAGAGGSARGGKFRLVVFIMALFGQLTCPRPEYTIQCIDRPGKLGACAGSQNNSRYIFTGPSRLIFAATARARKSFLRS